MVHKRALQLSRAFRPPRPSAFWQRVMRPVQAAVLGRMYRVRHVELRGEAQVRAALSAGGPVMFAVNHPSHGDPFVVVEAMYRLGVPCCYLAATEVFRGWLGLKAFAFQRLGAFSVDREGTDLRAFRTAVEVLAGSGRSLVIFPEGEVYHVNDRVTPLREGAAAIALAAARRRRRAGVAPLRIVPCGLKYFYLEDPTPLLHPVMSRLERSVYWRPRAHLSLPDRIYRFAEAALALKELEHLERPGTGTLPQRIGCLIESILARMEQRRFGAQSHGQTVPERIKSLRYDILRELPGFGPDDAAAPPSAEALAAVQPELEDLHLATQLFSYPGDYVAERPSIERIAETIDKFEEDALGARDVVARTPRRAVLSFGPAFGADATESAGATGRAPGPLTALLEQAIQEQIDLVNARPSP